MGARAEHGRRASALAAVVSISLGCGGTTVSNHDHSAGGSGGGATLCPLEHEGDLIVRTPAELEKLRGHHFVSGNLIVDCPDCTTLEPLGCLEEVGRMLSVVGCDRIESLDGLAALRRLGMRGDNGGLGIGFHFTPWETSGNARLRTLAGLGPLESVEGRIHVLKNPELRDLSALSGLEEPAVSMFLVDNDALPSLEDLSSLRSARNSLELTDNDGLVDLTGLGSFTTARLLRIAHNDALVTLAGLDTFWGSPSDLTVQVLGNPLLVDVTALRHLQGTLRELSVRDNASLREVSFHPGLAILSGGLSVSGNENLVRFRVPGLMHIAEGVHIDDNPRLDALDLGAPASVGSVSFTGNGTLRDTSALASVRVVGGTVMVENNTALERVTMTELQEVAGDVRIYENPLLVRLELDALRSAGSIGVAHNPLLPSCHVVELTTSVESSSPGLTCGNAPDECATECPPRP